ncbi:sulfate adenylyltransferase subunit 1 [Microbacterium yannicii]|uniref:sulfate adenylyltransferase subunit 1 n=1 Tax=Microbacterium yannicii TaxID=671622 RepID=UPI0002E69B43|nr:GTP-binding protein [Microbacterium yannicii]
MTALESLTQDRSAVTFRGSGPAEVAIRDRGAAVRDDAGEPTLFRFATAGSVDDGKSTLVGRLLHDSKAILADQLEQVARTSADRGFAHGEFDFALLTDGLRAEREQGITIDVAYRYFSTGARSFVLADCPGHVQYTRNMVTGATTADAVVVLVDARKGVVEQTRRHLAVVALLRVPHVIVAVNKIDLTGFSGETFAAVSTQAHAVAAELGVDDLHVLPVSALEGDNIVDRSERTPWYDGPALLELLETLPGADELEQELEPLRLPIQLVLRPQGGLTPELAADSGEAERLRDYRAVAGRIASGVVRVGDRVEIFPSGIATTVTGIRVAGAEVDEAVAPQSVSVELADDVDTARGALVVAAGTRPAARREFDAELFQLDARALTPGIRVLVKHGTATVQAIIAQIESRYDLDALTHEPAQTLETNDIGRVRIRLAADLPLEPYRTSRHGGSFLVIHPSDGATLAAGIVR